MVYTFLLSVSSNVSKVGTTLVELGRTKAGLLFLFAAFGAGISFGGAGVLFVSDAMAWGERITETEIRLTTHIDSVATPGFQRLQQLERQQLRMQQESIARWEPDGEMAIMRQMVHEMYCAQFPARCYLAPGGG
jgi:hypothetical protein